MPNIILHWFRRDLRLDDNTALIAAAQNADFVIPLFVLDDTLLDSSRGGRSPRIGFMVDCLHALHADLKAYGSGLVIRHGDPMREIPALMESIGAQHLVFNRDYSPYARQRDDAVTQAVQGAGYSVETYQDLVIHEYDEIATDSGHYQVFTPYKKQWLDLPKPAPQALEQLPPLPDGIDVGNLPSVEDLHGTRAADPITEAGSKAAQAALDDFIAHKMRDYDEQRNFLAADGTSKLSPHLRWGTISIRRCFDAADRRTKGGQVWVSELVWREFYQMILAHNPYVLQSSYRPKYDAVPWDNNREWFERWQVGNTGYPVVDAAMRQLLATGWMHNRARMIVASFLCKDLLIDWRWGERYFMQHLIDGDSAANNGGWQWAAGTGTDAAPYFRIFNPTSQAQKFDPEGKYIRQWIPELAGVADKYLYEPWQAPQPPGDYPAPLVDHKTQREKALAMYGVTKDPK